MRKISVAITAAALAVSMLAAAFPAAAVTGYDSAYAGESAFVTLAAGQSNEFQVFFANTGTTTWTRGTGVSCRQDDLQRAGRLGGTMELGLALGHALRHDHADGRVPGLHRDL